MNLSQQNLTHISPESSLSIPEQTTFQLPEKVLQFGTGVLLRGLPDYFIDKANRMGLFNGRIVVVKSTSTGDTAAFEAQDNLYTLCVRGIENNVLIEENIINTAISRVIAANSQWNEVLAFAESPDLGFVFSNTTEIGIQLQEDNIHANPPSSFPGKLLAVLLRRYQFYKGDRSKGLIILPAELISDNGSKLKEIVVTLAQKHDLGEAFISWLTGANTFCNTLVDRIIPGKPDAKTNAALNAELGYKDDLLSIAESYRLWAIEGDERLAAKLTFAAADEGVIITPDINLHSELKLRLLNGTHTLSCAVAYLAGFDTVKQAMNNPDIEHFISSLMKDEIGPAIPYPVSPIQVNDFANRVLDRFRNPHIKHNWLSISMNYTLKLRARVLPLLLQHYDFSNAVPEAMALSFAAYLKFMNTDECVDGKYYATCNHKKYAVNDPWAQYFYQQWKSDAFVTTVLNNESLWGTDLTKLKGFADRVQEYYEQINNNGIMSAIQTVKPANLPA
ncbi:altronate oxidoreductase [Solitalea longa]|uniref:Altronate oxidoreductase n=1 Tax=Solitalea longa TaxID=2079460 RepID=A0A2S4ZZV5_9SPHI|nr:tagaturonate reductase [Solitalea longa]POY35846.1 altronate oxidoreductase [Solitalea longa]